MSTVVMGGKAPTEPALTVPPIVSLLQLAEEIRNELNRGRNRAEIAKQHGVSRARVSQLLNLLRLHPDILAHLRQLRPGSPARLITEHRLRSLSALPVREQLERAAQMIPSFRRTSRE